MFCALQTVEIDIDPNVPQHWPSSLTRQAAELIAYWTSKSGTRAAPARADIDPSEIKPLLPCLMIVDVEPDDFVFRLVGTHIVSMEGECTNQRLSDLFPDRERDRARWRQYRRARDGIISVRHSRLDWLGRDHVEYETVLMPLIEGDGKVAHLLGIAHANSMSEEPPPPPTTLPDGRSGLNEMPGVTIDETGIVTVDYTSRSLSATVHTVAYARQKILELGGGERVPVLVRVEAASGLGGPLSDTLMQPEHAQVVAATAVIAHSTPGRVFSGYYEQNHNPDIPVRLFEREDEAKSWLRQYLPAS